jgi:hypothetical protein
MEEAKASKLGFHVILLCVCVHVRMHERERERGGRERELNEGIGLFYDSAHLHVA